MIVTCPKCEKKYDLDRSHLAKGSIRVRCPNCKQEWVVKIERKPLVTQPPIPEKREVISDHPDRTPLAIPKLLPVEDLIILKMLVGFLGEKPQFGWWDSNFLSMIGLNFLNIIFPRSAFSAGVNSVTEVAKRLHDNRTGKGKVYHLFRLPEFVEQRVHKRLIDIDPATLLPWIESRDNALEKLKIMAEDSLLDGEGPVQLNRARDLCQLSSLKMMAKATTI
jgi:predicted Zn finger-like uncharacterized protein